MHKRIIAGLLTLMLLICLLPVGAIAEEVPQTKTAAHTEHSGWTAWNEEETLPGTEGNYYLATGLVETNYRLISTTIRITDESGAVAFEKTLFTAVDKWINTSTNDYARTNVTSFDLAAFAVYLGQAQLETGKTYTYELSAVPGTGESYILKTFTFVQ